MSIYENNLHTLESVYPRIKSEILEKYTSSDELKIVSTPSGYPTARFRGVYLHSKHNPKVEADRLIEREIKGNISCCIFAGFGLGYQVESFLEIINDIPVIIVEPDTSLFLKALEARNMDPIFSSSRVSLLLGVEPEAIYPVLSALPEGGIKIFSLRGRVGKDQNYFFKLEKLVSSFIAKREINSNTLKKFGRLWVRNLVQNLNLLAEAPGISSLEGLFKGIPAIILAAGPSLDLILPYLEILRDKFLLISVDTAYRGCLSQGVNVDFLLVVDPQFWNTRHLDRCNPEETILISETSTHPRIFRMLNTPAYICSSLFPLGRYLEKRVEKKGKLGAGGSVSTSAWDFARIIGANPIFFAGLDLGYPQKQTHYRGSFFEELLLSVSKKNRPFETALFSYIHDADSEYVENNSESRTLSDKRLLIYKWWFETQMPLYPETQTYNLAPLGVKIKGISYKNLSELFGYPECRNVIDKKIEEVRRMTLVRKPDYEKLHKAVLSLNNELIELKKMAQEGLEEIRKLKSNLKNEVFIRQSLIKLDSIDRKILKISSRDVAGFLLQELFNKILYYEGTSDSYYNVLETTEQIYRHLRSSCLYQSELLMNALNRLKLLSKYPDSL